MENLLNLCLAKTLLIRHEADLLTSAFIFCSTSYELIFLINAVIATVTLMFWKKNEDLYQFMSNIHLNYSADT